MGKKGGPKGGEAKQASRKEERHKKEAAQRSRKGHKEEEEWRKGRAEFNAQLRGFGLELRDTIPDGNCLFRCGGGLSAVAFVHVGVRMRWKHRLLHVRAQVSGGSA